MKGCLRTTLGNVHLQRETWAITWVEIRTCTDFVSHIGNVFVRKTGSTIAYALSCDCC